MTDLATWLTDEEQLELEDSGWVGDVDELMCSWAPTSIPESQPEPPESFKQRSCDGCGGFYPFAARKADRPEGALDTFRPASGRGGIGEPGYLWLCEQCLSLAVESRLQMPVRCTSCLEEKAADNFRIETRASQPIRVPLCHECRSFKARKSNYGITKTQYNDLLKRQGGVCAICRRGPGKSRGKTFHVDHCHGTGAIRGLLCARCNHAIGNFQDDIGRMVAAIEYLSGHANMPAGGKAARKALVKA